MTLNNKLCETNKNLSSFIYYERRLYIPYSEEDMLDHLDKCKWENKGIYLYNSMDGKDINVN